MRRTSQGFLQTSDVTFGIGLIGLVAVLGGSLDAGRAYSVAMELQGTLHEVVDEARTQYLANSDPSAAHEAAKAKIATQNPAIKLADVQVDASANKITVVGKAPIEVRVLAPFGFGHLQVTHSLTMPLK